MTAHLGMPIRAVTVLAVLVMLVGCNKSGTSTETSTDVTGSAASAAPPAGQSLMDQLGGMPGANQLADAFAANMASNPSLSSTLTSETITSAKQGLVNEIAKASGTAEPNPGASLLGALSGKGLSPDQVNAVTGALNSAADGMSLTPPVKSSVMAIMEPVSKALMG